MFFTYGFLPDDLSDAKQVMLDMTFPDDDPLAVAKNMLCHKDPGVKIVAREDEDQASGSAPQIYWESQILWWASVNEEDGLHIGVAQRMDGTKELEATWKDKKIESPGQLQEFLASDPSWDIFQLRAVVLLLDQVETLLASSHQFDNIMDRIHDDEILTGMHVRPGIITEIFKLRELEGILMQRAVQTLTSQVRSSVLPRHLSCFHAYLNFFFRNPEGQPPRIARGCVVSHPITISCRGCRGFFVVTRIDTEDWHHRICSHGYNPRRQCDRKSRVFGHSARLHLRIGFGPCH